MDRESITKQIWYQLGQLSSANEHHRFEDLCRYIAAARIAKNILPATGPVSAGGDQGRDFETFASTLSGVSLISDKRLAFACSLQKDIVPKIRLDVQKIAGGTPKFDAVHYFCTETIPVRKRHELENWATSDHDLSLYIHDRHGIASHLTARDTIKIAIEFLGLDPAAESVFVATGGEDPREVAAMVADYVAKLTRQPFAGREEEFARLDAIVARGGGRAVITGRAGYGKTLLAAQWIVRLQSRGVHVASHLFRQGSGSSGGGSASDVSRAYASLGFQIAQASERGTPDDSLWNAIREYSGEKPLVVIVDGLDEAASDPEVPMEGPLPPNVTIVASVRSDQLAFRPKLRSWTAGAELIDLQRLSYEAVLHLLRNDSFERVRRLPEDRVIVESLERTARGFPLYLGYLIDDLRQAIAEEKDPHDVLSGTPIGFADYVRDRAHVLFDAAAAADEERRILATLAVANGLLPMRILCDVANVDETRVAALPPRTARWLVFSYGAGGDAHYGFQHDLLAAAFRSTLQQRVADATQSMAAFCVREASRRSEPYVARNAIPHLIAAERWNDVLTLASTSAFLAWQRAAARSNILTVTTLQAAATAAVRVGRPADAAAFLIRAGYFNESTGMEATLQAARKGDVEEIGQLLGAVDSLRRAIALMVAALELARAGRVASIRDLLSRVRVNQRSSWPPIREEAEHILPALLARLAIASPPIAAELAEKLLEPGEREIWLRAAIDGLPDEKLDMLLPFVRAATADEPRLAYVRRIGTSTLDIALELCALAENTHEASDAAMLLYRSLSPDERADTWSRFAPLLGPEKASITTTLMLAETLHGREGVTALLDSIRNDAREGIHTYALLHALQAQYLGQLEPIPGVTFETVGPRIEAIEDIDTRRAAFWLLAFAAAGRHPDFVRAADALLRMEREHRVQKDGEIDRETIETLAGLMADEPMAEARPLLATLEAAASNTTRPDVLAKSARFLYGIGDREGALRVVNRLSADAAEPFERLSIARTQYSLGLTAEAITTVDGCVRDIVANVHSAQENFVYLGFKDKHLAICASTYMNFGAAERAAGVLELIDSFSQRAAAATTMAVGMMKEGRDAEALDLLTGSLRFATRNERVGSIANLLVARSTEFSRRGDTGQSLTLLSAAERFIAAAGYAPQWIPLLWPIHLLQRLRGAREQSAEGFERVFTLIEQMPPSPERRKTVRRSLEEFLDVQENAAGSFMLASRFDGRSRDASIDAMSYVISRDLSRELGRTPDAFADNFREAYERLLSEEGFRKTVFAREMAVLYWRIVNEASKESQFSLLTEALQAGESSIDLAATFAVACWTGCHEWIPEKVLPDIAPYGDVVIFDVGRNHLLQQRHEAAWQSAVIIRDARVRAKLLGEIATSAADPDVREKALTALAEMVSDESTRATPLLEHCIAAASCGWYDAAWASFIKASERIDCRAERDATQRLLTFTHEA